MFSLQHDKNDLLTQRYFQLTFTTRKHEMTQFSVVESMKDDGLSLKPKDHPTRKPKISSNATSSKTEQERLPIPF